MRWLALVALGAALAACGSDHHDACELGRTGAPWVAFSSLRAGTFGVWITRADGSCARAVTSGTANDLFPSFGPSWRVAYTRAGDFHRELRIHDLATAQDWVVAVGSISPTAPAFSPDGSRIAFEGHGANAAATDIYVVPAAGGDPVALTTTGTYNAAPAWSPDGVSTIYFVAAPDGIYDVYAVPVAGGATVRVTTRSGIIGRPAVSPDGAALYYTRSGAAGTEVVRRAIATGAVTVVTSHGDSDPALSPAGDRLAVRSRRDGGDELYVVNATDGSGAVRISSGAGSDGAPSFQPSR
jgi:Tol biopolymer transport system component